MIKWKNRTYIVMILIIMAIVAVLIYDALAVYFGGTEASISSIIINLSYEMPFMVLCIGFCTGVLFGHLFWRMKPNKDTTKNGVDKIKE